MATSIVGFILVKGLLNRQNKSLVSLKEATERRFAEQDKKRELAEANARKEEKVNFANAKRKEAGAKINRGLNYLKSLKSKQAEAKILINDLKEGEKGKLLAGDKAILQQSISLLNDIERKFAKIVGIDTKKEELNGYLNVIEQGEGSEFTFDEETEEKIYEIIIWAKERVRDLDDFTLEANNLIKKAETQGVVKSQYALGEQSRKKQEAETEKKRKLIAEQEAKATDEINKKVASFYANLKKERGEKEIEESLKNFKHEMKLFVEKQKITREKELAEAGVERAKIQATQTALVALAKKINYEAEQNYLNFINQLRKDKLWQEVLRNPDIKGTLKPFLDKGYYDYATKKTGNYLEPIPISYSYIAGTGALDKESIDSLIKLGKIGSYRSYDKHRTGWGFSFSRINSVNNANRVYVEQNRRKIADNPDMRKFLLKAQKYLIDYGEIMVEKGWLAP